MITDFNPYQADNIPLYETIYGKHLISLGGLAAIDNMFSGLAIKKLRALDLGFGLGGVAFYLAEKYRMDIAGIELQNWMVQYARDHAPDNTALEFHTYTSNGEFPFQPQTFDLVYSKGVLNHVADKKSLFKQVSKMLKPHGLFVIADWIFPSAVTTDTSVPLVCETQESYEQVLAKTGFEEIEFRDDSKLFLGYAKELLNKMENNKTFIEEKYGQELFEIIKKQHEELIDKINQREKFAVRITAKRRLLNG